MEAENTVYIPLPALFSFEECLWFLNRNYDDCLHFVGVEFVIKAVQLDGQIVLLKISQKGQFLAAELLDGDNTESVRSSIVEFVTDWFDMDRDIEPFYKLLEAHESVKYMADAFRGLRLVNIRDLFEALCWSIMGQQINLTFAYKLKRRLVEKFGRFVAFGGKKYYLFPDPKALAEVTAEDLYDMQFSRNKARFLIGMAESFESGIISKEIVAELPDLASKRKFLLSHKGVGEWTANYALMKSLREPDCVPVGDVGLLQALSKHGVIVQRSESEKINLLFQHFKLWESYLVFYLWRSLAARS